MVNLNMTVTAYDFNGDIMIMSRPQLQYDNAKKQVFRNLIKSGKEIIVPEKNVTIGGWTGTRYVVRNPHDGTGAYI